MTNFSYVTEEGLKKLKEELDHLMNSWEIYVNGNKGSQYYMA